MTENARAMLRNRLKETLARGELAVSMIVKLVRTIEIAQIAKTAGFDSFYLDNEHNAFSIDTTSQICMAGLAVGITPLVRVPGRAPEYISRVLDAGALGVIAPHIESAREAEEIVQAAKFPPFGRRSITAALPQLQFQTFPTKETIEVVNDATMIVAMIETPEALSEVDAISAVPGVDILLVGANDLSASFGIAGQYEHPRIRDAFKRCADACGANNKTLGVGGLASRPELMREFVNLGARYVSTGADLTFLLAAATAKATEARDLIRS